jgi:hypothetical protein
MQGETSRKRGSDFQSPGNAAPIAGRNGFRRCAAGVCGWCPCRESNPEPRRSKRRASSSWATRAELCCARRDSNSHCAPFESAASCRWATRTKLKAEGVEPSSPRSRRGILSVERRFLASGRKESNLHHHAPNVVSLLLDDALKIINTSAGARGIEPRSSGLESVVLPLHHAPKVER